MLFKKTREKNVVNVSVTGSDTEDSLLEDTGMETSYLKKAKILSDAIDDIGFGKYQVGLFIVSGFGWLSDNAWPVVTSLILNRVKEVDGVHPPRESLGPLLTLAQNVGLLAGALFWPLTADLYGRKWAFNFTFLWIAIWAIVAGSSPNFAALGVFCAFWSFGVGGNLPVDSAIFLENLPTKQRYLLTVLSCFWAIGQVIANGIARGLVANFACSDDGSPCYKKDNKGWRYFLFTMGGFAFLMFLARFLFNLMESPKFYMANGDNASAIKVLHRIAQINGKTTELSVDDLEAIDEKYSVKKEEHFRFFSSKKLFIDKLRLFNMGHIRACFATKRLCISSSMVIFTWGIIGLAFPLYNAFLPYYLETRGNANKPLSVNETYRNSLIVAAIGVPGALLAGLLVELRIGRKGALSISLVLTGVFLYASTTAKTPDANLGWNCAFTFLSNIMYGVLYAYTPEIFATKIRGTGVGLAASANRLLGIFSPVIAICADLTTSAPIFVSGALFILAGLLAICYPYESRGKVSL